MNFSPELLILTALFIWLAIITVFCFKIYFYSAKTEKIGDIQSLTQMLDSIHKREEGNKKTLANIIDKYDKLEESGLSHIQKIGLVRFNPFKDTGGDQSFILALVDAENTGVVISSLHTRTGTRWYAKGVVAGKGIEYDLSEEEEKALRGAALLSVAKTKK